MEHRFLDEQARPGFLEGGGAAGALIRAHDWTSNLLGTPDSWPGPLKTLAGVMLGSAQAMFIAWGPERVLLYNDAYSELLGRKHPAAMGRNFYAVWPEVKAELTPLFDRVFAGQAVQMADLSLVLDRHGKPEEAHFAFSYTPVRDSAGEIAGLFCACTETTAEVLAARGRAFRLTLTDRIRGLTDPRAIMAEAVTALGRALRASRVGYAEIDPDGGRVTMTTSYADGVTKLVGRLALASFGHDRIERQRRGETIVVDDLAGMPGGADTLWSSVQTASFVSVPLIRQGRFIALMYVNDRCPRAWSAGEVELIEDTAARTWDAVERAQAEAALRRLNNTLEQRVTERTRERDRLWRNAQDLLTVVDTAGVFQAVSPSVRKALGWLPEEMTYRSVFDFVHPDDRDSSADALARATIDDLPSFDCRFRHKDGGWRWISWVAAPEGDLIYATGRHVTAEREQARALHEMEEVLHQSQKMEAVGQLTGGLAHDFNNLLAGISGSLELAQARLQRGLTADCERYIGTALATTRRAAALTHRLLAFSRRQTLDPSPTDVNRLVSGMEELIRGTVGPQIELHVTRHDGLWQTLVDPNQLENALLNLCINARDAMPEGGRLAISTANVELAAAEARDFDLDDGAYIRLCVTDTGTGMSPEVMRRAFEPFFTTKPVGAGSGLGLSMIYGFVRQSGGQARVISTPGEGTTICMHLPRMPASEGAAEAMPSDEPDAVPATGTAAPPTVTGRILVVDDDVTVRMLVAEVLHEAGYTVLDAGDGPGGLALLRSDAGLDLLVTDLGLPGGLTGRQLANEARALRPGLAVLFITGYADSPVLDTGTMDSRMRVLDKPFPMDVFLGQVADLIQNSAKP